MPSPHSPSSPAKATASREPRSVNLLIKAAKALIADGQMDSATVDDIVRTAGVSKRSFYNHFADREALNRHVIDTVHQDLSDHVRSASAGIADPAKRTVRLVLATLRYCYTNRFGENMLGRVAVGMSNPKHPGIQPLMQELRDGTEQRVFKLASMEAGIVLVFGACVVGASRLQQFRNKPAQANKIMRETCIAVLRGLRVEKARLEQLVDEAMENNTPDTRKSRR